MNNVNITDSNFISTIVYKKFMIENTGRGILNIRASFANQALPITNLKVVVSKEIENYNVIFYEGVTNISGLIEKISLPTPPKENDDLIAPKNTTYKITTLYNNREYTYVVNMYDGICVVQNINIVPSNERKYYVN
ncbi:MAG: hypothetical protein PUG33_08090 [Mollicutes bacterium]|mgnify:FL=1|nr:hypothetical protein [Mollicutes bacterium]